MKIVLIIDSLGSGGAERQCVVLAVALKLEGHDVSVLGYNEGDHFLQELQSKQIPYSQINKSTWFGRILHFRKLIRTLHPDVIYAFLQTSAVLAELASVPFKPWKLIVSERNNITYFYSFRTFVHLQFHRIADSVTTNAFSSTDALVQKAPYLRKKTVTIYNGLDLVRFSPGKIAPNNPRKVITVVSTHQTHKNALNLVLAMNQIKGSNPAGLPVIHWYGSALRNGKGRPSEPYLKTKALIETLLLEDDFILFEPVTDIERVYRQSDALLLCSLWEGLPNVVCEAMACGLPILMSQVSDYIFLTEGNGRFFDPESVESIAAAIRWFCNLGDEEKAKLRLCSREKAERHFSVSTMTNAYQALAMKK